METNVPYVLELKANYPSKRYAEIAYHTLQVDKEPSRGGCKKTMNLSDNVLVIKLEAAESHTLRNASNACLDFLSLITETMKQFDVTGS